MTRIILIGLQSDPGHVATLVAKVSISLTSLTMEAPQVSMAVAMGSVLLFSYWYGRRIFAMTGLGCCLDVGHQVH